MNQPISDELISAYLDGELSGDEQAQVEELLMDSAAHRKMFNELRALRDSLQSLPHYTLADDFSDRVLRRAERAMLSQSSAASAESDSAADDVPIELAARANMHTESNHLRRAIWALAAVAAALLVTLFVVLPNIGDGNNENGGARNVADLEADREDLARDQQNSNSKMQRHLGLKDSPDAAGGRRRIHSTPPGKLDDGDDNHFLEQEKSAAVSDLAAKENKVDDLADRIAPAGAVPSPAADPLLADRAADVVEQALDEQLGNRSLAELDYANETVFVVVEVPDHAYRQRAVDLTLAQNGIREQSSLAQDTLKRQNRGVEQLAMSAVRRSLGKELESAELQEFDRSGTFDVLVVDASPDRIDAICNSIREQGFSLSVNSTNSLAATLSTSSPTDDAPNAIGRFAAKSAPAFEAQRANEPSPRELHADEETDGVKTDSVKSARDLNRGGRQAFGGFNAPEPADPPAPTRARSGPVAAQGAPTAPNSAELKADAATESRNSKPRAEASKDKAEEDAGKKANPAPGTNAQPAEDLPPAGYFIRVPALNEPGRGEQQRLGIEKDEGGKEVGDQNADEDEPPRPDSAVKPPQNFKAESASAPRADNGAVKQTELETVRVIFVVRAAKQIDSATTSEAETKPAAEANP